MFESLIKTLMQTRRPSEEAGRRFQSRLYFPGKREQPWKRIAERPRVRVRARPRPRERLRGVCVTQRVQTLLQPGELESPGKSPKVREGSLKPQVCSALLVGMIKTLRPQTNPLATDLLLNISYSHPHP